VQLLRLLLLYKGAESLKLKIAFLQLRPSENTEDNIEKGIKACREAKEKRADIALFPEMWSSGYTFLHNKEWLEQNAVSLNSKFVMRFSELASELDMAIAVTLLEKHDPKPRNTVCLFDRHGKLVYRYSKVHICDFGEDDDEGVLDAGDGFYVGELDTKEGMIKVGSMICYDREFPESARILMLKGAELILVPNACPMEINRLSQLRGRAYENMLAIATCNYPAPYRDCNGNSTLFDGVIYDTETEAPRDMLACETGVEEGVFLAELDVDMLRKYRSREEVGLKNRRPELYRPISEGLDTE
jgi:predicted amidohydrolase